MNSRIRIGASLAGIVALLAGGIGTPASAGQKGNDHVMTQHQREVMRRKNLSARRRDEFALKHSRQLGGSTYRATRSAAQIHRDAVRQRSDRSTHSPSGSSNPYHLTPYGQDPH